MPIFRFSNGQKFRWNGENFAVNRAFTIADESDKEAPIKVYIEFMDEGGNFDIAPRAVLDKDMLEGRLFFIRNNPLNVSIRGMQSEHRARPIDDYNEQLVEIARWRQSVIAPLRGKEHRTSADVVTRIEEVKATLTDEQRKSSYYRLSKSTVYDWLKIDRESNGDLSVLIPRTDERGGLGKSRLDETVDTIVKAVISDLVLNSELGAPLDEVHGEIGLRIDEVNNEREKYELEALTKPGRTTVWEHIQAALKKNKIDKLKKKEDKEQKKSKHRTSRRILTPTGEIEIDTTTVDMIVVSDDRTIPIGRLELVAGVDKATGYPWGRYIGFEPESHYATLECLYHGALPKFNVRETYGTQHEWYAQGIPSLVRTDRGPGYNNKHLRDASESIPFELDVLEPRTPFLKPFIESQLGVTNDGFHYLDGTTFSSFSKRGDYDSLAAAVFTCFEVDMLLHQFLLDIVAEKPLRGITGISRSIMWRERTLPPFEFRLHNADYLRIALGSVEFREITDKGIQIDRIQYNSNKTARLREIWAGEKAKVKFHPGDRSRVHVLNPEAKSLEERYVEIPAIDQEYTQNLSSWQHKIILKYLTDNRKGVHPSQFAEARRVVRGLMAEARQQTNKIKERQRAERMFSTPPSSKKSEAEQQAAKATDQATPRPINKVKPESLTLDPELVKQMRIIDQKPRKVSLDPKD